MGLTLLAALIVVLVFWRRGRRKNQAPTVATTDRFSSHQFLARSAVGTDMRHAPLIGRPYGSAPDALEHAYTGYTEQSRNDESPYDPFKSYGGLVPLARDDGLDPVVLLLQRRRALASFACCEDSLRRRLSSADFANHPAMIVLDGGHQYLEGSVTRGG